VGAWQRDGEFDAPLGVPRPLPFQGGGIARVAQTGRTARIDLETASPELRERMLAAHVSSGVAAPIVVSGRLWGATAIPNGGDLGRFPRVGVGGADADGGTGLRGLSDQVEALGGHLRVSSELGRGTTVRAELPLDAS
jgi:hypothetical protein